MPGSHAYPQLLTLLVADPRMALLFALLVLAALLDTLTRRIPNWLTGGGLLLGLASSALFPATHGIGAVAALQGAGLGLLLVVVLYALRIMGAGDVKLIAMTGAFLGVPDIGYAVLAIFITGGCCALAFALYKGALPRLLGQFLHLTRLAALTTSAGAGTGTTAGCGPSVGRMPYAVSIAAGTIVFCVARQAGYW